jgi:nucleotide-binding universal stress UspA family protein
MQGSYHREPTYEISFRFRRILVPVDGSEASFFALDLALDFARRYGSRITVLHVRAESEEHSSVLEKAKQRASKRPVVLEFKERAYRPENSSVASEILKEIYEGGYDAVFMGARGTTVSEDIHVGSTALSLVTHAPVTVVVVR